MPALETLDRTQPAVLWPARGVNDQGEILVADPVSLMVRWVQKRRETQDSSGNPVALDATAVVDRQIEIGSLMWLGHLKDLPPGTSFTGDDAIELMQVQSYNFALDLKGRFTRHSVGLMRYRQALPA